MVTWLLILVGLGAGLVFQPGPTLTIIHHGLATGFVMAAAWRFVVLAVAPRASLPARLPDDDLPPYTLIIPLHREAAMMAQIVGALDRLEYPRDRFRVILALEAHDTETIAAARALALPQGFEVLVVPHGRPTTKPRACNYALEGVEQGLVTIYDAEDRPDPDQLHEAAARFAAAPPELVCLQAPLRIAGARNFLQRQFALEYAAQFEVLLPAMARLGLAFPLGGTSNHFRVEALKALGGWDAFNVTEDADLGFRLARAGGRSGVLASPTFENAPDTVHDWLPQRTRWLKGYMQTWGVQTRNGAPPLRIGAALGLTIALSLASAAMHLPLFCWLAAYTLFFALGGPGPSLTPLDWAALAGGLLSAYASLMVGARRAGLRGRSDILLAPFYWPLLTIAFLHALPRLLVQPHHWDKTHHEPWLSATG